MGRRRQREGGDAMANMVVVWHSHLGSGLSEDLVLLQKTDAILLLGDLEEGDALDGGHFGGEG